MHGSRLKHHFSNRQSLEQNGDNKNVESRIAIAGPGEPI